MNSNPSRLGELRDLVLGACVLIMLAGSSIVAPQHSVYQLIVDVVWTALYVYGTYRIAGAIRDDVERYYGWSITALVTLILLLVMWWVFVFYIIEGWL